MSTRCRNHVVSCPKDIVLDMGNVYNDVVWGNIDVVNDMRNVYYDVVWCWNDVCYDMSMSIATSFTP